jgi:putative ABC transport system permease protein
VEPAGIRHAARAEHRVCESVIMNSLRMLFMGLFRRARVESEMEQELRFHMESRAADLEWRGLSPADAKRRARLEFGGVEGHKERCREACGFRLFDELRADVRYAFRTLRHNTGFASIVVLSLALGIGVNLACFASLYAMVLHPFPYPNLSGIMTVSETRAHSPSERDPVAPANYLDWKQSTRSFEHLAAYRDWDVNLTGVDHPDHIHAALASSDFFHVLGLPPVLGRTFTPDECEPGRDAVVVVSHGFWRTRLASAPDAIGKTVSLGSRKYKVIGVMPDEFNLPLESELWAPLAFTSEKKTERGLQELSVIGKLRPGVSPAQAGTDMEAVARRLEKQYPRTNEQRRALVTSLRDVMKNESDRFLAVLVCAALFVLLLACINVGSLQIARATARQKEIGLRRALGASHFRIFRQLLTESLVVGLAGGALGLALAAWYLNVMRSSIPLMVYRIVAGLKDMRMNGEIAAYGILLSIAASILCCVPVALQVVRSRTAADLNDVLKEGGRNSSASPSRSRFRITLVVAEVALAFVLLVGAGLMVGTLQRFMTLNLGYDVKNVLTAGISLSGNEYQKPARMRGFYDGVLHNLDRTQDIEAAAAVGEIGLAQSVSIEGRAPSRPGDSRPDIRTATPQYLRAMRIPLLKGRWLSEQDGPDKLHVVVLSASVVRHYWPNSNPIGERIKLGNVDSPWLTVVGVTGDVKDWFLGDPLSAAYVSYRQFPQTSMQLLVRSLHDSRKLGGSLRLAAEAMDREQPIYNVHTLEQQMYEETSGIRNAARMMSMYAAIALLLAVTGIYSVSSFFVTQRTREIGVRMSFGATRWAILRMVLSQSCGMTGIGLLIGVPLAILLTIGMSRVLYNIVAVQPIVFLLFIAVLGTAAGVAGYIPAYRAARVDPIVALRQE